jgi:hypothetical protein
MNHSLEVEQLWLRLDLIGMVSSLDIRRPRFGNLHGLLVWTFATQYLLVYGKSRSIPRYIPNFVFDSLSHIKAPTSIFH